MKFDDFTLHHNMWLKVVNIVTMYIRGMEADYLFMVS